MLYARHFLLQTDHQPLLKVLGSKKGIQVYTANCLQRWALTLLPERLGHHVCFDNELRRFPVPTDVESEANAILDETISNLPVTHQMIVAETRKDPVSRFGNPSTLVSDNLQTFFSVYRSTQNRNTPQSVSPTVAFLARPIRTTLDLLEKPEPLD